MINTNKIQRLVIASAFATGLLSVGVAASAQTTAVTAASTNAAAATTVNATSVSMSTVVAQPDRKAELAQANADARRIAFRNLGTSL